MVKSYIKVVIVDSKRKTRARNKRERERENKGFLEVDNQPNIWAGKRELPVTDCGEIEKSDFLIDRVY